MMTQMAPMLEMMKAKMGKRRFAMMMQTMGPMMSRMMEGGGGGLGGMMGGGGMPAAYGGGGFGGMATAAATSWACSAAAAAANDEHDPAADAHGQCRRRRHGGGTGGGASLVIPRMRCDSTNRAMYRRRDYFDIAAMTALVDDRQRRPHRRHGSRFGPQRVRTTLAQDSTPSTHHRAAASAKKFCAVASCVDSHQPPARDEDQPRGLRQHRAQHLGRALRGEIHRRCDRPMKAYIGAAVDRYCRLAARTPASSGEDVDPEVGEDRDEGRRSRRPTTNDTAPAIQAMRRARAIRPAPIAMPIIGTEAMPTANAIDVSMNSSRAPMP